MIGQSFSCFEGGPDLLQHGPIRVSLPQLEPIGLLLQQTSWIPFSVGVRVVFSFCNFNNLLRNMMLLVYRTYLQRETVRDRQRPLDLSWL